METNFKYPPPRNLNNIWKQPTKSCKAEMKPGTRRQKRFEDHAQCGESKSLQSRSDRYITDSSPRTDVPFLKRVREKMNENLAEGTRVLPDYSGVKSNVGERSGLLLPQPAR